MPRPSLPIIGFIPGATSGPATWDYQVKALKGRAHCIVIDLRDLDSIDAMAERVKESLPEKVPLVGTSMGGYVAIEVARRWPGFVSHLVLANTRAGADTPEQTESRWATIGKGPDAFYEDAEKPERYARTLSPTGVANAAFRRKLRELDLDAGYGAFMRHHLACMGRKDQRPFLPELKMPVLIIGGADDKMIPPVHQMEIAALVPQAQVEILKDCGHQAQIEKAAEVSRLLTAFLPLAPAPGVKPKRRPGP